MVLELKGSASGTAYAPASPILSQVLSGPKVPKVEPFTSVSTAPKKKPTVPESTTLVSVEELKAMSVKELQDVDTAWGWT